MSIIHACDHLLYPLVRNSLPFRETTRDFLKVKNRRGVWNFSSPLAHSAAPQSFSFDYFTLTLISRSFPPLCPLSLSVLSFLFILLLLSSLSPLLLHPPLHPPHPLSSHRSFLCLAVSQCWPSLSHLLSILQNSFFSSYYLFLSDSSSISSLSSLGSLTSSLWPRSVKYR